MSDGLQIEGWDIPDTASELFRHRSDHVVERSTRRVFRVTRDSQWPLAHWRVPTPIEYDTYWGVP